MNGEIIFRPVWLLPGRSGRLTASATLLQMLAVQRIAMNCRSGYELILSRSGIRKFSLCLPYAAAVTIDFQNGQGRILQER